MPFPFTALAPRPLKTALSGALNVALIAALLFAPRGAAAQRELAIPAPRGLLNDFASVVAADRAAQIERVIEAVRAASGGEIAVVTLPDIGGRDVADVALRIGREWKVGAKAEIGDARRNAGVVVLLVPKETSSDGKGYMSITIGNGAEGFIPDAVAGDIRREATPLLQQRNYSDALLLITLRLGERYAGEFNFALDSALTEFTNLAPRRVRRNEQPRGVSPVAALVVVFLIIALLGGGRRGGRGGCTGFLIGQAIGSAMGRRGGYHGGGGFGGGFGVDQFRGWLGMQVEREPDDSARVVEVHQQRVAAVAGSQGDRRIHSER